MRRPPRPTPFPYTTLFRSRPDGDRVRWERALAEPGREEALREAVGAGGIELADAGVVRRAQDLVRSPLQRLDTPVGAEVMVPTERDVSRASDGGQPEANRRYLEAGGAKRPKPHP